MLMSVSPEADLHLHLRIIEITQCIPRHLALNRGGQAPADNKEWPKLLRHGCGGYWIGGQQVSIGPRGFHLFDERLLLQT